MYLDVGCAKGTYSIGWLKDSSALVYAFEPLPVFYRELKELEKQEPRFKVFPYAISEEDGEAEFHINNVLVTSSLGVLSSYGQKYFVPVETIKVKTQRLDTFCQEYAISKVEWLKVDAQGWDLKVLRSLGIGLHQVCNILVEAYLNESHYEGCTTNPEAITEFLVAQGFKLKSQRNDGDYTDLYFVPA